MLLENRSPSITPPASRRSSYIETGPDSKMHVITANKGPVVHGYRLLTNLARRRGRRFLLEFDRHGRRADLLVLPRNDACCQGSPSPFRGILNSTTNLILTRMEKGEELRAGLAIRPVDRHRRDRPRRDVDGWDAAIKVAALVTVLMHPRSPRTRVKRRGIDGLTLNDVQAAARDGRRWKLVCRFRCEPLAGFRPTCSRSRSVRSAVCRHGHLVGRDLYHRRADVADHHRGRPGASDNGVRNARRLAAGRGCALARERPCPSLTCLGDRSPHGRSRTSLQR